MTRDDSVPGFSEISDWPFELRHPIRIADVGGYRDGGPQGGTGFIVIEDAVGRQVPFFFDRFLGRLCYGSATDLAEDAAFLKKGSRIQVEAFALIGKLIQEHSEYQEVAERLAKARRWI